ISAAIRLVVVLGLSKNQRASCRVVSCSTWSTSPTIAEPRSVIRYRGDERRCTRLVIDRPPRFSVGTQSQVSVALRFLDCWTAQSQADFTCHSWPSDPQSLAHSIACARCYLRDRLTGVQQRELVGRNCPPALRPHV